VSRSHDMSQERMVFTGDTIFCGCQTWLMTSDVDQWLELVGDHPRARRRHPRPRPRVRHRPVLCGQAAIGPPWLEDRCRRRSGGRLDKGRNPRRGSRGDFTGDPAVSTELTYEVDVEGDAPAERLRALVDHVDRIAEIPNSLREGTPVRLAAANAVPTAT
jgi:hypothetical protein